MNNLYKTFSATHRPPRRRGVIQGTLLTIAMTGILPASAQAGLILSLTPSSSSITIGETVDIELILTQTDPAVAGADITTNGLVQADVELSLDSTAATVSGFSFGPGFTDFASDTLDPFAPLLSAQSIDINGVTAAFGSPTSLTLGTFTFTGNSVGTTTATTVESVFQDFAFEIDPGDIDSQIFGLESTTITVSAVPEPGAFAMCGVAMVCAFVVRRRRRARR